jgi:hypothetical protein
MCYLYIYEYWALKGEEEEESDERDKPNWNTLCAYMEMSQWNPSVLMKMLKNKDNRLKNKRLLKPSEMSILSHMQTKLKQTTDH